MSFAFTYSDLQANRCTESPDLSNIVALDNNIHPLFQRRNFRVGVVTHGLAYFYAQDHRWHLDTDVFPFQLYARILPAVRLASLMLDRSLSFFDKLMHTPETPHPWLPDHTFLDPGYVVNPFQRDQTIQSLDDLADHLRFYISCAGHDAVSPSGDRWQGIVYSAVSSQTSPIPELSIGLAHGYIDFFAGDQYARATQEQRLRTNFMLARLMMHELVHAVRQWVNLNQVSVKAINEGRQVSIFGGPSTAEPWFGDVNQIPHDPENELGRAWEDWFFNGLVRPIGLSRDYSVPFGFCIVSWADWFEERQHAEIGTKIIHTALTANSISRLFDKRTWEAPAVSTSGITLILTPLRTVTRGVHDFDTIIPRLVRTAESQRWAAENLL